MAETRQELSFELERFEWAADDRLEVVGRWQGVTGRRLARPVLHVEADGRRRRLTATPGGHLPATGGDEWRASFAWPHGPADVESAELEIGRSLLVELPAPRRRKRRKEASDDPALHAEIAELRAEIADLRAAPPEEKEEADPAELAEARERLASLQSEHDTLADQHAALIAGGGELRGELADALAAQEQLSVDLRELREQHDAGEAERERLAGELETARANLTSERDAAEQRMAEQRAENTEMREKIASAREEAQKAMAAEAEETETLRAELSGVRDESEKALAAERAETARLREELASRPVTAEGEGEEPDDAGRRMYERISRELERERATVRNLRRELESTQAQTAEQRRAAAAAAATNGVHTTTEEAPVAATAAGRRRAAAAVMAQRAEADPRAPYRRVEAARAAAASRVPEHEQSTAGVWATRAAAVALVAVLLIAMVIIVSAIA